MADQYVHVIDDDEPVRSSLAFLLESFGLAARTYDSAERFLAVCDEAKGCVVTDIRMPDMNGLELIRELQARAVTLPVIVMTGHGDVPLAVQAMKAGVMDFLEKPFDDEIILNAVRVAMSTVARATQDGEERARFKALIETLSRRETEVLRGIVAGETNKVIARDLELSPRTVEVYRGNVMTKTGAQSLSELVRMAILAKF
ncbi:MAG: response regulator FixJ [Phenylobacterium sp.]